MEGLDTQIKYLIDVCMADPTITDVNGYNAVSISCIVFHLKQQQPKNSLNIVSTGFSCHAGWENQMSDVKF